MMFAPDEMDAPPPTPTAPTVAVKHRNCATACRLALAFVIAAWIVPPRIIPDICLFKRLCHLPCPTCGLTRSVIAALHLRFAAAWAFHPFGIPLTAVVLVYAAAAFCPPLQDALDAAVRNPRILRWCLLPVGAACLAYGLWRLHAIRFLGLPNIW